MASLCFAVPAALLVVALAAPAARATQVTHLDLPTLARTSSDIVVGRVEGTQPHWNASHTKIVTDVTVAVTDALKGGGAARLTLTQLGGVVGNMRYTVPGSPAFAPGEEALLFVWRDARGRAQVNGLAQGKFDIHVDPASGERVVQRSIPGLAVREVRSLALVPAGASAPRITLSRMLGEIRQVLEEGGR